MIEGYMFFNEYCGNIQYKVGKTHTCKYGYGRKIFRKLKDAFSYGCECEDAKYCCKIEGNGEIIGSYYSDMYSEIYIKEELNFNDVLKKLSKDEDYCVRRNVAKNKNCPVDILRKLSEDEDYNVRECVAKNDNSSKDILEKLSEDKIYYVRYCVAENKNCPEDILMKLSEDENYGVRMNVAKNKNCPEDILRKLSDDNDWNVRINVVRNKNCSLNILKKLSKEDVVFDIRVIAKEQLKKYNNNNNNNNNNNMLKNENNLKKGLKMIEGYKFFNEDFKSDNGKIQYEVGKIHTYVDGIKISRKLKDAFGYCKNAKHCCKVIGSGEIIEDDDKIVCSDIYIKEELDFLDVLKELSDDEDWNVRYCVAINEDCSLDILRKLSDDENDIVRSHVAYNNNCFLDILRKLSDDNCCNVRYCVAENKNCPEDILEKLSEDEYLDVRFAAKKQLEKIKKCIK